MLDVDASAAAPVAPVVAVQEPLVDEVPTERGVVGGESSDDRVHGLLVVVDTRLELERDPSQDDPSFGLLGGDLGQTAVAEERAEHGLLVLVRRAEDEP